MGQTYSNLELLLIDDGSTDNSGALCDAYAAKDPRLRVLHQENQGVSAARNLGLDKAAGEYIAFVDADDRVAPEYLETLYRELTAHNADIVCCDCIMVDIYGKMMRPSGCYVRKSRLVQDCRECFTNCIAGEESYLATIWGKLFAREIVCQCRFSSLRFGEDTMFMHDIVCLSPVIYLTDYAGYTYVRQSNSATISADSSNFYLPLLKDHLAMWSHIYLHLPEIDPQVREKYAARYAARIHELAYAAAQPENKAERAACQTLLADHLDRILPLKEQLSPRLHLYLSLYAMFPWLYNFLVRFREKTRRAKKRIH